MGESSEFLITGFHAEVALWVWVLAVLLHGLWRSVWSPETDPLRPSGPTW